MSAISSTSSSTGEGTRGRPFTIYPVPAPALSYEVIDRREALIKSLDSWDYVAMRAVAGNDSPAQVRYKLLRGLTTSQSTAKGRK
ncbi:hypothetical protein POJ06DRAFT_248638 [Lipomyces tetrasporus]|uniref:Uncharacterized protein n=1 Tax=Lipomyces tetrasporus TaxID=54092 RepID=A0AAD7QV46_9ASCO|nr:uncharacterized protein POJ06DRAFT_248638 [Lipomyces tetrasporus]KAJ8102049.1 hypothetical protein POJ06DRAFT_248638 [Lipomyces tetrasporus]